jgi:outer membrane biosynthesis protein TonB
MAARLAAVLPRFVILTLVFLLATATLTFAAQRSMVSTPPVKTAAAPVRELLVVPDVRGQAYVFAKGILEDGGFAWRVEGKVEGYAANTVADQTPVAGTRVVDTGAPTIILQLRRNPGYAQEGTPENAAPFTGSAIRLADAPEKAAPKKAAPLKKAASAKKAAPAKKLAPAKKAAPSKKPVPAKKPAAKAPKPAARPPAFTVAGAPREPLDEITLPARARRLDAWLSSHRRPTSANVRAYLYQHSWIVTGAKFGWWRGEEALRVLVRVDRHAQRLWRIGAKSERVAERALRQVAARSR